MQQPRIARATRRTAAPSTLMVVLLLYLSLGSSGAARLQGSSATVRVSSAATSSQLVDLETLSGAGSSLSDDEPTLWSPAAADMLGFSHGERVEGMGAFDLAEARVYARLASVAYCNAEDSTVIGLWNCTRCKRVPTFKVNSVIFDAAWSLLAYIGYLPEKNAIVVVFRGSDNHVLANWLQNLRFWKKLGMGDLPAAPVGVRVHAGFLNMWHHSSLKSELTVAMQQLQKLHPRASLVTTGHSMGAALAQLCAIDGKALLGFQHVHTFTFGSPRVGNLAFSQFFEGLVDSTWRFTHSRDMVPSLPPTVFGYRHTSREVFTVEIQPPFPGADVELGVRVCDGSGEDPSCHGGLCFMGFCTSIADHLRYLEFEMYHSAAEC